MGKREEKHTLCSVIAFDGTHFGGAQQGGKRGRGTHKTKALAAVS
jgi:hypothetical protein